LATLSVNRNDHFAKDVDNYGHTIPFSGSWRETRTRFIRKNPRTLYPQLDELFDDSPDLEYPEGQDINAWIAEIYKDSCGYHLAGT
jgi:hypothetical protein